MKLVDKGEAVEIRSEVTGRLFGIYEPEKQTIAIRRSGETVQVPLLELMNGVNQARVGESKN